MYNMKITPSQNFKGQKAPVVKPNPTFQRAGNSIRVQILEREERRLMKLADNLQCCGISKKLFAGWIENVCGELQEVKGAILDEIRP